MEIKKIYKQFSVLIMIIYIFTSCKTFEDSDFLIKYMDNNEKQLLFEEKFTLLNKLFSEDSRYYSLNNNMNWDLEILKTYYKTYTALYTLASHLKISYDYIESEKPFYINTEFKIEYNKITEDAIIRSNKMKENIDNIIIKIKIIEENINKTEEAIKM